ncbi:MAG TPA: type VI secretion system tip protein VgrG [Chitinophagaceae bacterium]|jgi:Rhs element Vgr protein
MLDSLPPGTSAPTDTVTGKVYINGTVLSNEISLAQVTVNKTFNKISWAKLVFFDGSASDRDFPLSNDDKFKPGSTIKVQLGYSGNADTVFEGIIVKHAIKIQRDGTSLLMIEAKDKAITLTAPRTSAYYINSLDSDVITSLATGLTTDIDATTVTQSQLVQFDSTSWDFIVTRAEANGMLVLTDDGKLQVKKPSTTGSPVLTATYGQNIWEFEAEMDARRQSKSVKSLSWDFTQQATEQSNNGSAVYTENGNLSSDQLGAVLAADVVLNHPGHLASQQLQGWADSYALRNHLSKAAGRVRIEGNATVKPGNMITLVGVGDRFNGNVFVTGVLHHYEGWWHTDIQFGWREEWFYKKEDVIDKPAGGLLPGINGLQIGIVKDVNDTDNGGQYRVKVHVPTISTGNVGIWARVATLDAGDQRGVYFRPQQGDEVVLGFLDNDPREAIILGYLHSKSNKQSPLPEIANTLQYGFVTQQKLKLIFDDTNKRMTLRVPSGSGEKTIILNSAAGGLEISDENSNSIKMDASGISIQAGGNVIIKGKKVSIN